MRKGCAKKYPPPVSDSAGVAGTRLILSQAKRKMFLALKIRRAVRRVQKAKVVALTLETKPRQSQVQVPIKQQVKQKAVRRAATRNKKDLED